MRIKDEPKGIVIKRLLFIFVILIMFFSCFYIMNNKFDPLARYKYATKENRTIILRYMNNADIDYIVNQQIKPEQFMDFIALENFETKNILYYDLAKNTRNDDHQKIINFINKYRDKFNLTNEADYLSNYTYDDLSGYFDGAYQYGKDNELISKPNEFLTIIKRNETIYRYAPVNLVSVDYDVVPFASKIDGENSIYVSNDMINPLKQMVNELQSTNGISGGGLILTSGYISYDHQIDIYDNALLTYGADEVSKYCDTPGKSENQLGYTITFSIADNSDIENSDQVKWLKDNAYKYGFIIRYPKEEETTTGKKYQPLTLRYVGEDAAEQIQKKDKTLEKYLNEE